MVTDRTLVQKAPWGIVCGLKTGKRSTFLGFLDLETAKGVATYMLRRFKELGIAQKVWLSGPVRTETLDI